jgi:hypothetical protein
MTAPDLTFAIFYAVSANESRWWDVDAGRALGFEPVDPARTRINAYSVPVVPVVRVGDWIRLWMRAGGCSSVYP